MVGITACAEDRPSNAVNSAQVTTLTGASGPEGRWPYHQLWHVEKAFRMSKHDLSARPIYHYLRDSIDAHLAIVMAALAVSKWIETATGWSIRKFVKTTRRYRTITIQAGDHTITAADPVPADLAEAIDAIRQRSIGH